MVEYISAWSLPRRYCFGRSYIDNCSLTDAIVSNDSYKACIEGPVGIHFGNRGRYVFKNLACVTCNGYGTGIKPFLVSGVETEEARGKTITKTVVQAECPSGTVYDTTLKFCREGYVVSAIRSKLTSEYLFLLWFIQYPSSTQVHSKLKDNFKSALISGFSFQRNQISKIDFHWQDLRKNKLLVATFRLALTPFQSLLLANKPNFNATQESISFLKLFNATATFSLYWRNDSFFVIKVFSKRLSCYNVRVFQLHEYKIDQKREPVILQGQNRAKYLQYWDTIFSMYPFWQCPSSQIILVSFSPNFSMADILTHLRGGSSSILQSCG